MATEGFATAHAAPDHFAPEEVALHARDVHFDFSDVPLCWIENDPYGSHFITALNFFLPTGERFFCKAYTDALEYVKDERLREEMRGFMGQEAVHAKSHDDLIPAFLTRNGIDPDQFLAQVEWAAGRLSERIDQAKPENRVGEISNALLIIAGAEHFFAVLGNWVLSSEWESLNANPMMADLFRWHGAEEVEHRHVAHNVATYFGMNYARRAVSNIIVTIGLAVIMLRGTKYLVHHDPTLPNLGYFQLARELRQSAKRGSIPKVGFLLRSVLRLLKRNYTPDSEGNTAQAIAYLATSPAARAFH